MYKILHSYKLKEVKNMKIANFGVEEWLNVWENDAIYDIAGSSIASFTLEEIIKIEYNVKIILVSTKR